MGEFLSLFFQRPQGAPTTRSPVCPSCARELQDLAGGRGCYRCASCKGLWLSEKAFQWMLQAGEDKLNVLLEGSSIHNTFERSIIARQCPVCTRSMDNYPFGYQSGIWIDGCPDNHGIWLDGGELSLIRDYQQRCQGPLNSEERQKMATALLDGATESRRNLTQGIRDATSSRHDDMRNYGGDW